MARSPKRRAIARVDASSEMGGGHLARALTLAEALRAAGVPVDFVMCRPLQAHTDWVLSKGHTALDLGVDAGSALDIEETNRIARKLGATLVVVDGYQFDGRYLGSLREGGLFVCYVDDLANLRYECDAVINPNIYAGDLRLDAAPHCECILGPEYALVRDEFLVARHAKVQGTRVPGASRLLVTMGGADPTCETVKIMHAIGRMSPEQRLEVRIVVGAASSCANAIAEAIPSCAPHLTEVLHDVRNMGAQMQWADLAVTAAGNTCAELACVGVPALTIAVAENQRHGAAELNRLGLMRDLGWHEEVDVAGVLAGLEALLPDVEARAAMVQRQRLLIDGQGKHRVVRRLLGLLDGR